MKITRTDFIILIHQNKSEKAECAGKYRKGWTKYLGVNLLVDALHELVPHAALLRLLRLVLTFRFDALKSPTSRPVVRIISAISAKIKFYLQQISP